MELREWQYMNKPAGSATNNSSSSGYKKRFEKLIKYHIDHASSELESITKKEINDYSFHLGEHYNTGNNEFNRAIVVGYNSKTKIFTTYIYIDGREVTRMSHNSYEDLVAALESYMFLPDEGTSDYDDLLTESLSSELREWKYMNTPQPAASKNPYTNGKAYRYNRLLDQINADGIAKYKLNNLSNIDLDITVDTAKTKNLNIKIGYDPADDDYVLVTNNRVTLSGCDYEKDILPTLIASGVINNTDLCESASSIADDFKLYENLWD